MWYLTPMQLEKRGIVFTNGDKLTANHVVMAISKSVPTTTYLPAEALDKESYVKIQPK